MVIATTTLEINKNLENTDSYPDLFHTNGLKYK